MSYVYYIALTH